MTPTGFVSRSRSVVFSPSTRRSLLPQTVITGNRNPRICNSIYSHHYGHSSSFASTPGPVQAKQQQQQLGTMPAPAAVPPSVPARDSRYAASTSPGPGNSSSSAPGATTATAAHPAVPAPAPAPAPAAAAAKQPTVESAADETLSPSSSSSSSTSPSTSTAEATKASTLPALPSPEDAEHDRGNNTQVVEVNGAPVILDQLGPMVVGRDGMLSRIANWGEMTELERQNTLRILGKRNQLRLANLRGEKADDRS